MYNKSKKRFEIKIIRYRPGVRVKGNSNSRNKNNKKNKKQLRPWKNVSLQIWMLEQKWPFLQNSLCANVSSCNLFPHTNLYNHANLIATHVQNNKLILEFSFYEQIESK